MKYSISIEDTGRSLILYVNNDSIDDSGKYPWLKSEIFYEKDDIRRGSRDAALRMAVENIYFYVHSGLLMEDKRIRER